MTTGEPERAPGPQPPNPSASLGGPQHPALLRRTIDSSQQRQITRTMMIILRCSLTDSLLPPMSSNCSSRLTHGGPCADEKPRKGPTRPTHGPLTGPARGPLGPSHRMQATARGVPDCSCGSLAAGCPGS